MNTLRLCFALIAGLMLAAPARAQSYPVMIRSDGTVTGPATNLFKGSLNYLGTVVILKTNGVAYGLQVFNGMDVTGNLVVSGQVAVDGLYRRIPYAGTTNTLAWWNGTNGLSQVTGFDPALLTYLAGLTNNVNASLYALSTNWTSLGVARTNGTALNLSLQGTANLPSGAVLGLSSGSAIIGSLGSSILMPTYFISGNPFTLGPTEAAPVTLVDCRAPVIVNNLAALKALLVAPYARQAVVRYDTGSDGAAGDWIYDPVSTAGESSVIVRPDVLTALDPGRWFLK